MTSRPCLRPGGRVNGILPCGSWWP